MVQEDGRFPAQFQPESPRQPGQVSRTARRNAFTLIELLVVIAVIGLLISILVPALSSARQKAQGTVCTTRLRSIGQGIGIYLNDNRDSLMPARLPKIDEENWRLRVAGGVKYRPTFLVLLGTPLGLPPFKEPAATKNIIDSDGQPGDRQNYSHEAFLCPTVPEWSDERNGAYGFNYQFLGNARLSDGDKLESYKNWPVKSSRIKTPAACVGVADSMGTAAAFSRFERRGYQDNKRGDSSTGRDVRALGNEGFNLDPPRLDPVNGEMADADENGHTSVHERHRAKASILWMDGHCSLETREGVGYEVDEEPDKVGIAGDNRKFNIHRKDEPWIQR